MQHSIEALMETLGPRPKAKRVSGTRLEVRFQGPETARELDVFVFSDVLDELVFSAVSRRAAGILTGQWYLSDKPEDTPHDFIEVAAFRDIYPVDNSLDYATYLRRNRGLLRSQAQERVLGVVHMMPDETPVFLEDIFLQRTYFNLPFHIAMFVFGDGSPSRCFAMTDEGHMFEIGFYVVSLRNNDYEEARAEVPVPSE
ncbi:MAG: hypothetical protein FWC40_06545 [Proteobacteria bacterium]|nr:hypothetical protein [Pseudomonadota bacterium]